MKREFRYVVYKEERDCHLYAYDKLKSSSRKKVKEIYPGYPYVIASWSELTNQEKIEFDMELKMLRENKL